MVGLFDPAICALTNDGQVADVWLEAQARPDWGSNSGGIVCVQLPRFAAGPALEMSVWCL